MRTKTLALSALLGLLGAASAMAAPVYSVNGVGYINTTFPAGTFTLLTDPLIATPDNTLSNVMPNVNAQYKFAIVYSFSGGVYTTEEIGVKTNANNHSGWQNGGGDITLNPGQAVFFYNSTASPMSATFVGTIPQTNTPVSGNFPNGLTNTLNPGLNLIGSIVPASGDLCSNTITAMTFMHKFDYVYTYDPTNGGFSGQDIVQKTGTGHGYLNEWSIGDPVIDQVTYGFFYWNNQAGNVNWVENFSINP
jgi:hypothetical protein